MVSMNIGYIESKAADRDMIAAAYAFTNNRPAPEPTAKPVEKVVSSAAEYVASARKKTIRTGETRPTEKRKNLAGPLRELIESGVNLSDASTRLGISRVTARKIAKEAGFPIPSVPKSVSGANGAANAARKRAESAALLRAALAPEVRRYAEEYGLNRKEVAGKIGCTDSHVARIAEEHGIKFK